MPLLDLHDERYPAAFRPLSDGFDPINQKELPVQLWLLVEEGFEP
jgi:hypothetical protein